MFIHWPYTNLHELNLDWILNEIKNQTIRIDSQDEQIAALDEEVSKEGIEAQIRDSLAEMAQDGQLADILGSYTGSVKYYTNVAEMKSDANIATLGVGVTAGYYTGGDGGSAFYIIVAAPVSSMFTEPMNDGRYAVLLTPRNVRQFGAHGDGTNDDSAAFNNAARYMKSVHVPAGNYKLNSRVTISSENPKVEIFGSGDANIIITNDIAINVEAEACIIRNLYFHHSENNSGAIYLRIAGNYCIVKNCYFYGHTKDDHIDAITLYSVGSIVIDSVLTYAVARSIVISGSQNLNVGVNNCTLFATTYCVHDVSEQFRSEGFTFTNCRFLEAITCFQSDKTPLQFTFDSCIFDQYKTNGIYANGKSHMITNCWFGPLGSTTAGNGVVLTEGCTDVNISGNSFNHLASAIVGEVTNIMISNNMFGDCNQAVSGMGGKPFNNAIFSANNGANVTTSFIVLDINSAKNVVVIGNIFKGSFSVPVDSQIANNIEIS